MQNHFLVHHADDVVGVAVTAIEAGQKAWGVVQDSGQRVEVEVLEAIPLGHKVALKDLEAGVPVVKYGVPIGVTTRAIRRGEHVHTHNLKSARWA